MLNLVTDTFDKEEKNAIKKIVKSGYYTYGKVTSRFEEILSKKFKKKYALFCNSGSSANLLAISSLLYKKDRPLKRGDEVIVPALSWSTTYFPLAQCGLKLKFVDISRDTLNINLDELKKAITKKTKLICAVNILGNPCDLREIRKICNKKKIYFFEDNCESMGATHNKKLAGSYGDITSHSTFFSHHISTIEGGFVLTDNKELFHICKALRSHGWTRDLPRDSLIYKKKKNDFFEKYRFILPGYNLRSTDLNAAIGIEQIKKLDKFLRIRRNNAKEYKLLFSDHEKFHIQKESKNSNSSWFAFPFVIRKKFRHLLTKLFKELKKQKIMFRVICSGNILNHPVKKHLNYTIFKNLNNTNLIHNYGFFIGNHPIDITRDLKKIKKIFDKIS